MEGRNCGTPNCLIFYLPEKNVWYIIMNMSVLQMHLLVYYLVKIKVKCSRYMPGVAQMVGRGIALLFHDRGTRRGWVVSSTPRPHFTPWKDLVLIVQEAGWAPGWVWTGGKSRLHRDSILDRPACSQLLYRLSHPAHNSLLCRQTNAQYINDKACVIKYFYMFQSIYIIFRESFLSHIC